MYIPQLNQLQINILGEKKSRVPKSKNLNFSHASNYLHIIYIILGVRNNLEMIYRKIKVTGASLVAQMIKNPPAMQETWV